MPIRSRGAACRTTTSRRTDDASIACITDHANVLEDYDDFHVCGNGELRFSGPRYDFYVRNGAPFNLFSVGFEGDCYESWFGLHGEFPFLLAWISCHGGDPFQIPNWGTADTGHGPNPCQLRPPAPDDPLDYGVGSVNRVISADNNDYRLRFNISDLELDGEDSADLSVTMPCSFTGEVLVVGNTLTCNVRGANDFGPGLPRGAALDFTANPAVTRSSRPRSR